MFLRSDQRRVLTAFIETEWVYWLEHPVERLTTSFGVEAWDGLLWQTAVRHLQKGDRPLFFQWLDALNETHVKDQMIELIKRASPRYFDEFEAWCRDDSSTLERYYCWPLRQWEDEPGGGSPARKDGL